MTACSMPAHLSWDNKSCTFLTGLWAYSLSVHFTLFLSWKLNHGNLSKSKTSSGEITFFSIYKIQQKVEIYFLSEAAENHISCFPVKYVNWQLWMGFSSRNVSSVQSVNAQQIITLQYEKEQMRWYDLID